MVKQASKKKQQQRKAVPMEQISGRGNYFTDAMSSIIPKGTFSRLGGQGGGFLGGNVAGKIDPLFAKGGSKYGGSAGRWMGQKIADLVGFGDYAVVDNSLSQVGKAIQPGTPVPAFGTSNAVTRIKHREFISDVLVPANPANFNSTAYQVNPGNSTLFPWLASLGNSYQQYRFRGLIFEFVSTTSEVSAGGPMGSVILASNYDVTDANYANKQQMENSQFAVSAKPSCSQIHTMECDMSQTAAHLLYVDSDSTHTAQDPRWCDLANFQIATVGLPGTAGQVLGELWASYDIEFYKPEINLANAPLVSIQTVAGVAPAPGNFFGTTPTSTGNAYFSVTGNTITCNVPGSYFFEFAAACTAPFVLTSTGTASFTTAVVVAPLVTTTTFMQSATVVATLGQTVVISSAAWLTQASSVLRITRTA
jgi:hypothetical protein